MPDVVTEFERRLAGAACRAGFQAEALAPASGDRVWIWTRPANRPDAVRVFLSTGIHGDERCGPEALARFLEEREFPRGVDWVVAPLLNPGGFRLGSRENASGIDLNRDFLRRQAVETRSLIEWWMRQPKPCHVHVSLHEDWEAEGFYLYEINTSARESWAAEILRWVEQTVPLQAVGPVDNHHLASPGLVVHDARPDEPEGWPEAIWLTRSWPVLSYTFEAPGRLPSSTRVDALLTACHAALDTAERRLVADSSPVPSQDPGLAR